MTITERIKARALTEVPHGYLIMPELLDEIEALEKDVERLKEAEQAYILEVERIEKDAREQIRRYHEIATNW